MKIRICFVCLGNICRSPTAEGIMRSLVEESGLEEYIEIDSAGTSAEHLGEEPDPRTHEAAEENGISLVGTARQFEIEDFDEFEYVIAMDGENRDELSSLAPDETAEEKIFLVRDFEPRARRDQDVPDPYYGGSGGFGEVFDILSNACRGLLEHVVLQHDLPS
ncbi:MAG: low molecular weight phosphotyrosine protein phosphatase [Myxococcota bacterium]|nr:low molecular weight phosphotyrosine protein phosphatase [Myxococcota bacterium]